MENLKIKLTQKNSIIDTLNLLRKFKIINNFYKITIKKYTGLLRLEEGLVIPFYGTF